MREFAQLERGELIVGALPGLGPFWLSRFLIAFLKEHPKVGLRLIERNSTVLLKMLNSGEIHVGCVLLPVDDYVAPEGTSVRHLSVGTLSVVASPDHALARRDSVCLEQLVGERLILTSPEETPRLIVDEAFRSVGEVPDVCSRPTTDHADPARSSGHRHWHHGRRHWARSFRQGRDHSD